MTNWPKTLAEMERDEPREIPNPKGKSMTFKWEPRGTYGGVRRVFPSSPFHSLPLQQEAEVRPRERRLSVAIILQGRAPDSPQERLGRTITIMSTRNPRNSFKYGMIQKRDFGIRVIDIICQQSAGGVPFKAEKGGLIPFYAKKIGVKSHFIIGDNLRP
jgi:hypothetical protein